MGESKLDEFQDSPQLLDSRLRSLATLLLGAFAVYVKNHAHLRTGLDDDEADLLESLPRAVCKVLYTLCKIRGSKVISRFLSSHPAQFEPLLDAYELWDSQASLVWEERYVMILWLSHLVLTPFGLDGVSTSATKVDLLEPTFKAYPHLPILAHRLLFHGLHSIFSPSAEREVAALLLVRLSLRPDMQRLSLPESCIEWALSSLSDPQHLEKTSIIHRSIGLLSYLARFLASSDTTLASAFIARTFECIQALPDNSSHEAAKIISASAVARKLINKIYRLLAVTSMSMNNQGAELDILGAVVPHFLASTGDKDNRVRLSASKALSVIAQKLEAGMVEQLVDEITDQLNGNTGFDVLWEEESDSRMRLANVDPFHWHGLILTLAHLVYRRSASLGILWKVMKALLRALDFVQFSAMGRVTGSVVRDAACFGIWSLARNYGTRELLRVAGSKVCIRGIPFTSCIQVMANNLVIAATMDPEGNIRRGASAALQELVGRHPDTISGGIDLVQIVDYHAVGLESRARRDVALRAASVNAVYVHAVAQAMLSWRGVFSPDVTIRRQTASNIGTLAKEYGLPPLWGLKQYFDNAPVQSATDWHGLYLALARVIEVDKEAITYGSSIIVNVPGCSTHGTYHHVKKDGFLSHKDLDRSGKDAELAAEALCALVSALEKTAAGITSCSTFPWSKSFHIEVLEASLAHYESGNAMTLKSTAVSIAATLSFDDQSTLVTRWLNQITNDLNLGIQQDRLKHGRMDAVMSTMARLNFYKTSDIPTIASLERVLDSVFHVAERLLSKDSDVTSKYLTLKSLYLAFYIIRKLCESRRPHLPQPAFGNDHRIHIHTRHVEQAFLDCLDDHTTDAVRGDVGSLVRRAALEVASYISLSGQWDQTYRDKVQDRIEGLCVGKLDKMRDCAWNCYLAQRPAKNHQMPRFQSTCSIDYFHHMMRAGSQLPSRWYFIRGFISSAGSGDDTLMATVRKALINIPWDRGGPQVLFPYFHECVLAILKQELPDGRLAKAGLVFFAFLLDFDLEWCIGAWDYQTLNSLVLSIREVLRSPDLEVCRAVVAVYSGLARAEQWRKPLTSELQQILYHRYPQIRLAAAAGLWYVESDRRLLSLDLSRPRLDVKSDVLAMRESDRSEGPG
ncbi:MAG: hypothetical protein Q9174_003207 [Haloplaca sp. 1 TL-2023]